MHGKSAERSTVPRLHRVRFVLVGFASLLELGTIWAAIQLAQGVRARDAIESGATIGAVAAATTIGAALYQRKRRYLANPYGLSAEQRQEAVDAAAGRRPIPTDPRVRAEALRFARDTRQRDGSGTRFSLVLLLAALVGFGVAGIASSRWFLLAEAGLLPLLLLIPVQLRLSARLAELERLAAAAKPKM